MSVEVIARLEQLVDRLLSERAELLRQNRALALERDRLVNDRSRVSNELGELLARLDRLEGRGA
ncbi:MAG: cell division protein ZapB [Deltaproteobacteria bacterium]|nr:MAG: cell division protein ZapB [Deltaproteobacteria bacterium]